MITGPAMPNSTPPIYGLVLVGGGSTRMGEDKAWMDYHGQAEWQHARDCIAPFVKHRFISISSDQAKDERFQSVPHIIDRWDNIGPMNGIASAMDTHPDAAWLVVPCDMPGLNASTIESIIKQRSTSHLATIVENADGKIEPLCAVYEPGASAALLQAIDAEDYSLHRCLETMPIHRIRLAYGDSALNNINTPEESQSFRECNSTNTLNEDSLR